MRLGGKPIYQQFFLVIMAFLAMTVVGYWYTRDIIQQQIKDSGNEMLISAKADIKSLLSETEVTLISLVLAVEEMIGQGDSNREILEYLTRLNNRFSSGKDRFIAFYSLYGFIRNEYLDGTGWSPPAGFIPQARPWYVGARRSRGRINYTAPYTDARSGLTTLSISRALFDRDGRECGVLSIDFDMSAVADYVKNLRVAGGGYGILINHRWEMVVHRQEDFRRRSFLQVNPDYSRLARLITYGQDVSGLTITDYDGVKSVAFLSKLFNGWYIGAVTPQSVYYKKVWTLGLVLSGLSAFMALILCFLLYRMNAAKELADEKNRSKSTFLAHTSHEIRSLMNAIAGLTELIIRDRPAIPAKTYSQALGIREAGRNLLGIINDILDLSKIEAGRLEIQPAPYSLSSLINSVVNVIRLRLKDRPIVFAVNIEADLPGELHGDIGRIRQILINLLSNAVKFTDEGFVRLTVTGERVQDDEHILTFEVADSGIGIKPEGLDKLFDDFAQVSQSAGQREESSGLGLAITRSLGRMMGGEITVESEYGRGSVFTLTLPQEARGAEKFAEVFDREHKNIMVYEPRPHLAETLKWNLRSLGLTFREAASHADFLTEVEKSDFHFIFMSAAAFEGLHIFLDRLNINSRLILIGDGGQTVSQPRARIISRPVHSLTIANALNDVPDVDHNADHSGTVVRFTFPAARVLVVDDIEINLRVMEGLLRPYGMKVDSCLSGSEAIELVQDNEYDLVFMDYLMPGLDGLETTRRIRNLEGDRAGALIIIALSASVVTGMEEMFLANGLNDFLPKPVDLAKLDDMLLTWISPEKQRPKDNEAGVSPPLSPGGPDILPDLHRAGDESSKKHLEALELFARDARARIPLLIKAARREDTKTYAICVQSLKSALTNIGALNLSGLAAALEKAAQQDNARQVKENSTRFTDRLIILLAEIETLLGRNRS